MIVQCPACQSRYRISDSRIPAKGGNLKCPSCNHTFFVAGPQSPAGADGDGAAKTPAAPVAPAPGSAGGQPRDSLDEVAKALLDQLDDDDWLGGGTSPVPAASAPSEAAPAAPAAVAPEPVIDEPAGPTLSESARSKLADSLDDSLDDELASVLAAAAGAAGGDDDDAPAGGAPAAPSTAEDRWKVRTNMGLVFDFPDRQALRKWLGTRDSHEGMTISRDGGLTWNTVADTDGVSDIRPSIVRAGLSASAALSRRTGDVPAVHDAETRRAPAGGRAAALTGNSRHVEIPISTSEGQAAKRSAIWFVLLVIVIAVAGGLHFTGIVEIPGLPVPVQRTAESPAPAPTPAPTPAVEERPEQVEQEAVPSEPNGEAAQRVSMGEIYDATLDRARRLLREEDFVAAMRTAEEAQQLLPLRPDAFCLAADIASAADLEEEVIERRRITCQEKQVEAAARAAQPEPTEDEPEEQADDAERE